MGSPVPRAATEREASKRGDGARKPEVMCDPYEWKSAVRVALVIFVGFLALTPALAPDQKKLAAEINHHTLKAAAAIKSSTKIKLSRLNNGQRRQNCWATTEVARSPCDRRRSFQDDKIFLGM